MQKKHEFCFYSHSLVIMEIEFMMVHCVELSMLLLVLHVH